MGRDFVGFVKVKGLQATSSSLQWKPKRAHTDWTMRISILLSCIEAPPTYRMSWSFLKASWVSKIFFYLFDT